MRTITFLAIAALLAACSEQATKEPTVKSQTFWEGFDFADTLGIERKFGDFCLAISYIPGTDKLQAEVDSLLTQACRAGEYERVMRLANDYLWDPNSPYRNEESMIPFLRFAVESPLVDEPGKLRPRAQLESAMKNRKGTQAADFEFLTVAGKKGTLYERLAPCTVVYIFNPECHDCERASKVLQADEVLQRMMHRGAIDLIAVYPDEDLGAWQRKAASMPREWAVVRFANELDREKYDIRAIPSIYLLDSNKRVLYKDITPEQLGMILRASERL